MQDGTVTSIVGKDGKEGGTNAVGTDARLEGPAGLLLLPNGELLVADQQNCAISRVATDLTVTTAYGTIGSCGIDNAAPAKFLTPGDLARDSGGNLYVIDACVVRRITAAGEVSDSAGSHAKCGMRDSTRTSAEFDYLSGIAIDTADSIYVTDTGNRTVRKISGFLDGVGPDARLSSPLGITGDENGTFWIVEPTSSTLRKLEKGGVVTTLAGIPGSYTNVDRPKGIGTFAGPSDVVRDSKGNVYAVQYQAGIRKTAPDGTLSTLAGGGANGSGYLDGDVSVAQFSSPLALALDALDNLYVADIGNFLIRKITPVGLVTTIAGTPKVQGSADGPAAKSSFGYVFGLAVDAKGNVFVSDYEADAIRKIAPDGMVTTVAGTRGVRGNRPRKLPDSLASPRAITLTAEGDLVITTNAAVVQITAP